MPFSPPSASSSLALSGASLPAAPTFLSLSNGATPGSVNVLVTFAAAPTPPLTSVTVFYSLNPLPLDTISLLESNSSSVYRVTAAVTGSPATQTVALTGLGPGLTYYFAAVVSNS